MGISKDEVRECRNDVFVDVAESSERHERESSSFGFEKMEDAGLSVMPKVVIFMV